MKKKQFADINVTPFVDVMLVLLIIFMVTTPLMKKSLSIDLPEGQAQDFNAKSTDILVTLRKNGDLLIDDERVDTQDLDAHLTNRFSKKQSKLLYLQADKTLRYGAVMNMMGRLHKMGYKISLVMLPLKT